MERRLAAILAADVVGYTRLMGEDEAGTLAALKAHRQELIEPKIAEHRGRLIKLMGDGALVEFASVIDALACAAEIQNRMAARLEGLAEPGGICISAKVYDEVKNKLALGYEDLGEQEVKNICDIDQSLAFL